MAFRLRFGVLKYLREKGLPRQGEKLALVTAIGVSLLLLIIDLFWPGSGLWLIRAPTAHASTLEEDIAAVTKGLAANEPGDQHKPQNPRPPLPPLASYRVDDPVRFHVSGLFSIYVPADTGRRQPRVLLPDEARATAMLAQIRTYIFSPDHEKIIVLQGVGGKEPLPNWGNAHPPGQPPDFQAPGMQNIPVDSGRKSYKATYVALTDLADAAKRISGMKLATTIRPLRMAEIVASFPFKAQVEEFRDKLRLPTQQAVLNEFTKRKDAEGEAELLPAFRFLGVRLQRRVVDAVGKPLSSKNGGWEDIDLAKNYQPYLFVTGKKFEPDTPDVLAVSVPGLVMPRLVQARKNQYPKIETQLQNIRTTLGEMAKANTVTLPTHCLIRVIDVTIKPGAIYEYRMQVRLANPNFGRKDVANPKDAEGEELVSDNWYVVPQKNGSPFDKPR